MAWVKYLSSGVVLFVAPRLSPTRQAIKDHDTKGRIELPFKEAVAIWDYAKEGRRCPDRCAHSLEGKYMERMTMTNDSVKYRPTNNGVKPLNHRERKNLKGDNGDGDGAGCSRIIEHNELALT